ncbi:MAG: exodeoxyribonuclease VII large subunit [Gemmatimonadota bacterium]
MPDDHSLDLFDDGGDDGGNDEAPSPPAPQAPPAAPEPEGPRVWSVSQVNRAVRGMLEGNVEPLWVGGEIGSWTRSRAGHCYFTLKDDRAQIRSVMFQREAQTLPIDPDEGMQVRALGQLTLYEARGEYQLVVRRLEAEGTEGLWRLAFEKLRGRLAAEGLLDPARKRRLPAYPECVGVVTSPTGAALRDIVSVLRRRAPWTRVVVSGTRVQGDGASVEIAEALDALAASGLCDVILVSRGGGSIEDLWAFNEEPVARAVAACPVPVVSAVGHEVDVTICDLVADLRAPTPSAGAEAVVPDAAVVLDTLRTTPERLARGLRGVATRRRDRIEHRLERLGRAVERRLAPARQSVDLATARLERAMRSGIEGRRRALRGSAGRLQALSPLATLQRGYAVARAPDGGVLRSVDDFEAGRPFLVRVTDGTVRAETLDITRTTEDE